MPEDKGALQAAEVKKKAKEAYHAACREEAKILSSELEAPSKALLAKMIKSEVPNYFNEFEIEGMVYNIRMARKKSQPKKAESKK